LPEADAETYYLASQVALNDDQKRDFLQKAVDKDPFHATAYSALQQLKGLPISAAPAVPEIKSTPSELASVPAAQNPVESAQTSEVVDAAPVQLITAKFKSDEYVFVYPWWTSPRRTTAKKGSDAILLARTESGELLNILYVGSAGSEIVGWVSVDGLTGFSVGSNPVNPLDLPITRFEFNTRQEVEELLSRVAVCAVPFVPSLGKPFMVAPGTVWARIMALLSIPGIMIILGIITGPIFAFVWYDASQKHFKAMSECLGQGKIADWYTRLKGAIDEKKSTTELAMERQARIAALQIATSLGGTVLSRVVPNNQRITIRNR